MGFFAMTPESLRCAQLKTALFALCTVALFLFAPKAHGDIM